MTPFGRNVVTAVCLLGLLALVSFTAPRWARLLRQPVAGGGEEPPAAPEPITPPSPEASAEAQRTINVKLFFEADDRRGLVLEERAVPYFSDLSRQLRVVVEELVKGSQVGFISPLPPDTRVLEVFVTARGVAYVDLSKEVAEKHVGGSVAELHSVYSVVNTLTANFPAVRRVQILIEDRPATTLAGHVDLTRPLSPDMTLLTAALDSPASPSPGETRPKPAPSSAPTPAASSSRPPSAVPGGTP